MIFVVSKKLLNLLNKGITHELKVSIQYVWHVLLKETQGAVIEEIFRRLQLSNEEYWIVNGKNFFEWYSTVEPDAIHVGTNVGEILKDCLHYGKKRNLY